MLKVGFIGVGHMGSNIAYRLSKQSQKLKLYAWDINPTNISNLVQRQPKLSNITAGQSLLHTVSNADYIITCLPTSEHVQNTIKQCLTVIDHKSSDGGYISYQHPFAHNCCWLDCSSGNANISKSIHNELFSSSTANGKIHFLDCPVSGGPTGALEGNVQCMVGCNDIAIYEQCANDVLQHISFNTKRVGNVGAGHAVKCINNLLNVSNLLILSEGLQCLERYGIDINDALDVINHSSGRSLMSQERYPIDIIDKKYNYGFQLGLMKKDVHHARELMLQMEEKKSVETGENVQKISEIVAELLKIAVEKYGSNVDYTEAGKIFLDLHPSQTKNRT